jgi:RimJ/RimL family protein N-acetyltransferase
MHVRRITEDDVDAYWQLRLRGFREEPDAFGTAYDEAASISVEEVKRDLRADGVIVMGVFAPGPADLVAIAGLKREPRRKRRHRATLWGMHVVRSARGQGIGRALVAAIVREARAIEGLEQLILAVMAHNAPTIALYLKAGFVEYGRAPRAMLLDGRGYDESLMLLDLRTPVP